MLNRKCALAVALAAAVTLGAGAANPPVDERVKALEARVAALEKQVAGMAAAVAVLRERPAAPGPAVPLPEPPVPVTPAGVETASVKEVVDGRTLLLEDGRTVRLIGVDPTSAEREAAAFARYLAQGQAVRLETDLVSRDAAGRVLAYAYVGDRCVNAELIKNGYATAVAQRPNVRYATDFVALEREARTMKRGMWGAESH